MEKDTEIQLDQPTPGTGEQMESFAGPSKIQMIKEQLGKRLILIKAVLGELLCTFLFLFVAMATVQNFDRQELKMTSFPLISCLATGFAAVALIYSFADVSGANFNPSVSVGTWIAGKISFTKLILYIAAQLTGSTLATLMLLVVFPGINLAQKVVVKPADDASGETIWKSWIMELILTFILVYVIFATAFDKIEAEDKAKIDVEGDLEADGEHKHQDVAKPKAKRPRLTIYTTGGNSKGGFAPIAIGFTIGFLNFVGGTVSGGCYNPARQFGPALISMDWDYFWIYWTAGPIGGGLASLVQMFFAHNEVDPIAVFRPIINGVQWIIAKVKARQGTA